MTHSTKDDELIRLYAEMSDITRPRCGIGACRSRSTNRCCAAYYCAMAVEWARDAWGVELEPTDHPTIPFMGEQGCVVPPHLRPICTMHDCTINSVGCDPKDEAFTERYFDLRGRIDDLEYQREAELAAREKVEE